MSSDAERIIDLYQRHADEWDRERPRTLFEKHWLDRFLALLPRKASILDIGCGSAEPIARYVMEEGCDVTGVDSSPAFIGMCKARFPVHAWIVADMRTLSVSRRFNGILAWDSFFHLCPEDQRRMFPIFRQHSEPKAAFMFNSRPYYGEAVGAYKGEPLYHASLDGAEYRTLLIEKGFDVISQVLEDPTCGYRTIWLAQRTA